MIPTIKVAKDVAVKARTSAMISLKQVLVNAPTELREEPQPLTKMVLMRRCATLVVGPMDCVHAAAVHTLRSSARRWLDLDEEITEQFALAAGNCSVVDPSRDPAAATLTANGNALGKYGLGSADLTLSARGTLARGDNSTQRTDARFVRVDDLHETVE